MLLLLIISENSRPLKVFSLWTGLKIAFSQDGGLIEFNLSATALAGYVFSRSVWRFCPLGYSVCLFVFSLIKKLFPPVPLKYEDEKWRNTKDTFWIISLYPGFADLEFCYSAIGIFIFITVSSWVDCVCSRNIVSIFLCFTPDT